MGSDRLVLHRIASHANKAAECINFVSTGLYVHRKTYGSLGNLKYKWEKHLYNQKAWKPIVVCIQNEFKSVASNA